jgi:hypothetical protein
MPQEADAPGLFQVTGPPRVDGLSAQIGMTERYAIHGEKSKDEGGNVKDEKNASVS